MNREHWSSGLGFILACVGSAIGLGNIWLFPWRLSEFGGVTFLVPYLLFTIFFVIFGLMAELALGRHTQSGTIGAFEAVYPARRRGLAKGLGWFQVLAQSGLTVFYLVVMGWIFRYTCLALSGRLYVEDPARLFNTFCGSSDVIAWHVLAVAVCTGVVALGVKGGLERLNRLAMPLLFILLLALLVRSLTLPGAIAGLGKMLEPKWHFLGMSEVWVMALGQSFFTVSLGGMLIYGSYMTRDVDLPKASFWIVSTNFAASMLAALIIIPAALSFGMDMSRGPGLLFMTMPEIFKQMPAGLLFGGLFFVSVLLAGMSSAVNLIEVPTEAVMHAFKMRRPAAALVAGVFCLVVGLPLAVNMERFGLFVDTVTVYLYPLGVLTIAVAAAWVWGKARAEINHGAAVRLGPWYDGYLRYVFVGVCIAVIILHISYGGIG